MLGSLAYRIARAASQARCRSSTAMANFHNQDPDTKTVAVVGGGLAGAACAHQLASRTIAVTLYDMGRSGLGGRSSTRRTGGFQFDHGCQFIRAQNPSTHDLLWRLEQAGVAAPWTPRSAMYDAKIGKVQTAAASYGSSLDSGAQAGFCGAQSGGKLWVGVPGMSAICDHLGGHPRITARRNCKVTRLEHLGAGGWRVFASQGGSSTSQSLYDGAPSTEVSQVVDFVVLADVMTILPGLPGSVDMGAAAAILMVQQAATVGKVPIYALMAVLPGRLHGVDFDAATVVNSDAFQWISCDTSKPGRARQDDQQCWVAVTTSALGERLVAEKVDREGAAPLLWAKFQTLLAPLLQGQPCPEPVSVSAQRWGAAFKPQTLGHTSLVDWDNRLALCGDFCGQADAEGALLSGRDCGQRLADLLAP